MRTLVVTCLRNEAPHLLEWIAHHRAIGVTDFLIYTNDCDDGTDRLCALLAEAGILQHRPNPAAPGESVQWAALKAAPREPLWQEAEWIAVIDCDEFINLRPPLAGLADLVEAAGRPDAIAMPWRLFGNAGAARAQPELTVARFTRAAPVPCHYPFAASFFKTLWRRAGPFRAPGVHRPKQSAPPRMTDGSGRLVPPEVAARQGRIMLPGQAAPARLVQLNHYPLRSAEEFMVKRLRGLPNRGRALDAAYWIERNFNTVEDDSILVHRPALEAELARLRALPGVAEAEEAGRAWHRAAFARLMHDPEAVRLYGRLLMVPSAVDPGPEAAAELARLYRAAMKAQAA
ncbi:MAG: glycosyltransferase family 2 protein [Alphaproteobacteria bacterium]|nr:MAG: glycosyltransferase family 2 protein [Alphaproteobacteria bacterium]